MYRFRNTVWITSLCIFFIVLMGLIGYVNDETQRRSKEIAIRKVNGAEAPSILSLLAIQIILCTNQIVTFPLTSVGDLPVCLRKNLLK